MHIATFSYCALAYQVPFNDINSAHHQNWNKIQLWYSVFVFVIHLKSPPLLLEKALVSNQIQPCMYKSFVNITVISLKYQFLKYQFFVAHHNQVGGIVRCVFLVLQYSSTDNIWSSSQWLCSHCYVSWC